MLLNDCFAQHKNITHRSHHPPTFLSANHPLSKPIPSIFFVFPTRQQYPYIFEYGSFLFYLQRDYSPGLFLRYFISSHILPYLHLKSFPFSLHHKRTSHKRTPNTTSINTFHTVSALDIKRHGRELSSQPKFRNPT